MVIFGVALVRAFRKRKSPTWMGFVHLRREPMVAWGCAAAAEGQVTASSEAATATSHRRRCWGERLSRVLIYGSYSTAMGQGTPPYTPDGYRVFYAGTVLDRHARRSAAVPSRNCETTLQNGQHSLNLATGLWPAWTAGKSLIRIIIPRFRRVQNGPAPPHFPRRVRVRPCCHLVPPEGPQGRFWDFRGPSGRDPADRTELL